MADGAANEINTFLSGIADFATRNLIAKNRQREEQTIGLAQQLAASGKLGELTPDMHKAIEKAVGKENFGLLNFQSQLAQKRSAPIETLRQGAVQTLQAPVQEQIGTVEGQQPVGPDGQPLQGPGAPQPLFSQRAPTPQEQFQRFNESTSPLGAALIAGENIGQLSLEQAKLNVARTAATAKDRKLANDLIVDQAKKGLRVLPPVPAEGFDWKEERPGFIPVKLNDEVYWTETDNPEFKGMSGKWLAAAKAFGVDNQADMTPEMSRKIIEDVYDKDIKVAAAQGRQAAQIKQEFWLRNPLGMNYPDHGYFDTRTGRRLSSGTVQSDAIAAEDKGNATFLNSQQRTALTDLKKGAQTFNQILTHYKAVYGPGGIFETMKDEGRFKAGVKGAFAQVFQTDPELVVAKRSIDAAIQKIGRQMNGAAANMSDVEGAQLKQGIARLGGLTQLPDDPKVVEGLLREMYNTVNNSAAAVLGNTKFQMPELFTVEDAPAELASAGAVSETTSLDPNEVDNILRASNVKNPDQYKTYLENHPTTTTNELKRIVLINELSPQLKSMIANKKITLQQAIQQQYGSQQQQQQ